MFPTAKTKGILHHTPSLLKVLPLIAIAIVSIILVIYATNSTDITDQEQANIDNHVVIPSIYQIKSRHLFSDQISTGLSFDDFISHIKRAQGSQISAATPEFVLYWPPSWGALCSRTQQQEEPESWSLVPTNKFNLTTNDLDVSDSDHTEQFLDTTQFTAGIEVAIDRNWININYKHEGVGRKYTHNGFDIKLDKCTQQGRIDEIQKVDGYLTGTKLMLFINKIFQKMGVKKATLLDQATWLDTGIHMQIISALRHHTKSWYETFGYEADLSGLNDKITNLTETISEISKDDPTWVDFIVSRNTTGFKEKYETEKQQKTAVGKKLHSLQSLIDRQSSRKGIWKTKRF